MKIKVLGKVHRVGTSKKTGNDYDFIQLHYLGKEPGVEGQTACTVNIDPAFLSYEEIKIGADYNVEYGPRGGVVETLSSGLRDWYATEYCKEACRRRPWCYFPRNPPAERDKRFVPQ